MPNFDGTGPGGQGPMTGGKRGRCRNSQSQNIPAERQFRESKKGPEFGRVGRSRGSQGNYFGGNSRKGQGRRFGN